MSSPSTNAGVHRRRPSVLVATPSSMDVPGLSSNPSEPTPSLLSNSSSGSIHQMTASPQTYTPTAAATGGGGGSSATSRRRRASSSNEPSAAGEGAGSGSTAGSRGKKSGRRSTGHSEHPSPGPQAHHLSTPAEGVDSPSAPSVVTDAAAAVGSSSLAPASHPHQQQQQQPQPLNPYAPPPTQPQPASHSSSGGSTSPYGQFGHGPTLRTLPASSARKAPPLRTISSSSSTAIHYPASPTRSARADDLVPISPGSGFLPSHSGGGGGAASLAGQSLLYGSSAADGSSAGLPPYSVNPTASSSSSHSLGQLLPSLPLPASSGFNTAFQTAQTSPTLAVSLQMEGGAAYGGQSRFFGSNPSSPGPSSPTTSEPEEHDHGHGAGSYGAYYPPSTTLEKLLPSKDDVREKASEWRRWWKRRNSRSYSTGRPGASGILSSAGSVADRKKRRRRAGSGVGGSVGGPGGGRKWWRRFRPERKRGWVRSSSSGGCALAATETDLPALACSLARPAPGQRRRDPLPVVVCPLDVLGVQPRCVRAAGGRCLNRARASLRPDHRPLSLLAPQTKPGSSTGPSASRPTRLTTPCRRSRPTRCSGSRCRRSARRCTRCCPSRCLRRRRSSRTRSRRPASLSASSARTRRLSGAC